MAAYKNTALDNRYHRLVAHLRADLIVGGRAKRDAKEIAEYIACRVMPHFTDAAIAARCGLPASVLFG